MKKSKIYLILGVIFLIIAVINLFEPNPDGRLFTIFIKIGWFIMAGTYLYQGTQLSKRENG